MGKSSKRRKAQEKQAEKKAAKQAAKLLGSIPTITEDDLLAFQFSHFGDDTKPDNWFVDAETAVNGPFEEEDDLGYYDDGVKRTLTDEHIAMFRHSEIQGLLREERLRIDEEQDEQGEREEEYNPPDAAPQVETERPQSPLSVSSLEDELMGLAIPNANPKQSGTKRAVHSDRQRSRSARSDTTRSTGSMQPKRKSEVPYEQRHKRKWEKYIEREDPVEGSMTHRRVLRQLDEAPAESVDMDY